MSDEQTKPEVESTEEGTVAQAESVVSAVAQQAAGDPHHDDVVKFMGGNMPIYTAVFVILGVLTLTEVVLSEIISGNAAIPFLVAIASAKATLVVMYYMHLRTDSRVYTIVLAVPVVLAILSILFLLGVPTGGY